MPEPPATVEAGPNVAAPSADDHWLPGSWVWQQNRYAWRPGNWVAGQQDWQWVPAYYVWTPRGYVFVDGYWDYSVSRRGMLFAPVYFRSDVYSRRGFSYSPSTVISAAVFGSHLFLRPSYGHYYFGDYYGSNYSNAGYSPWFSFQTGRTGYDPFYAHQRWQNRRNSGWENGIQLSFRNFSTNESSRPSRTWRGRNGINANATTSNSAAVLATSLDDLAQSKDSQIRLQPVNEAEREQYSVRGRESRKFLGQRQQLEANAAVAATADTGQAAGPATANFAKSPFVGTNAEQLGRDGAPPQRYEALKPDLAVEPRSRNYRGNATTTTGTLRSSDATVQQGQPTGQAAGQQQTVITDDQRRGQRGQDQGAMRGQQRGASFGEQRRGSAGQNENAANGQQRGGAVGEPQRGSQGQNDNPLRGQQRGAATGQRQSGSNAQAQSSSNGQQRGASAREQQVGSGNQGRSGSSGQQQGASNGQQRGESRGNQGASRGQQRGGSSGQQQTGSGGQNQGGAQDQGSDDSKKKDKDKN